MKPLAEHLTKDYISFEVHSITGEGAGEISPENYIDGPEKYSLKQVNISLLSIPDEKIFDLIFAMGCPCKRTLYSGAPYI